MAEPQRKSYSIGTQYGPGSSLPRARLRLWWGGIERVYVNFPPQSSQYKKDRSATENPEGDFQTLHWTNFHQDDVTLSSVAILCGNQLIKRNMLKLRI